MATRATPTQTLGSKFQLTINDVRECKRTSHNTRKKIRIRAQERSELGETRDEREGATRSKHRELPLSRPVPSVEIVWHAHALPPASHPSGGGCSVRVFEWGLFIIVARFVVVRVRVAGLRSIDGQSRARIDALHRALLLVTTEGDGIHRARVVQTTRSVVRAMLLLLLQLLVVGLVRLQLLLLLLQDEVRLEHGGACEICALLRGAQRAELERLSPGQRGHVAIGGRLDQHARADVGLIVRVQRLVERAELAEIAAVTAAVAEAAAVPLAEVARVAVRAHVSRARQSLVVIVAVDVVERAGRVGVRDGTGAAGARQLFLALRQRGRVQLRLHQFGEGARGGQRVRGHMRRGRAQVRAGAGARRPSWQYTGWHRVIQLWRQGQAHMARNCNMYKPRVSLITGI